MSSFDTQIEQSKKEVEQAQAKIAELTGKIESARDKMSSGTDITIDIENATLDDVHAHTNAMNANIAELILGLDDVTAGFSKDFDAMRSKTGWESFVGVFSNAKSESMRQERMRTASIDDKLQDLISKSDIIVKLLEGQLSMLEGQKVKVEGNLTETLDEREMTVGELEALRAEIMGMDPKIIALENKIAVEQDAAARTEFVAGDRGSVRQCDAAVLGQGAHSLDGRDQLCNRGAIGSGNEHRFAGKQVRTGGGQFGRHRGVSQ